MASAPAEAMRAFILQRRPTMAIKAFCLALLPALPLAALFAQVPARDSTLARVIGIVRDGTRHIVPGVRITVVARQRKQRPIRPGPFDSQPYLRAPRSCSFNASVIACWSSAWNSPRDRRLS